jgi:hypothetical protein
MLPFELVGRTGTTRTHQQCRLFDPLFSLNSMAVAPFRKAPIGSISGLQWTTTMKYLRRSRAGVVLSQLQIGLFTSFSSGSVSGFGAAHSADCSRRAMYSKQGCSSYRPDGGAKASYESQSRYWIPGRPYFFNEARFQIRAAAAPPI